VRRSPLVPAALSAVLAASLLAACGGDDDDSANAGMSADESGNQSTTTEAHEGDGMEMDDGEMNHDEAPNPVAPGAREIDVDATSFEFGPPEIDIRAGEDVAIVLSADDIEHDFVIDELDTHISAGPGETAEGGLRVDEAGRYTFYCSVSGHREAGMEGTLVVS
jgi:cytochrome c oxidase subunit 2